MHLHADPGMADDRGADRGDEKADAPESMRAVHDAESHLRLDAADLDIETDLERAAKQADEKQKTEHRGRVRHEGHQREQQRRAEKRDHQCQPRAQSRDDGRGQCQRDQRTGRHADQRQAEFRLVDIKQYLQVGNAREEGARRNRDQKKCKIGTVLRCKGHDIHSMFGRCAIAAGISARMGMVLRLIVDAPPTHQTKVVLFLHPSHVETSRMVAHRLDLLTSLGSMST